MENLVLFELVTCDEYEAYLTGSNNFRYAVAKTVPYKGNRVHEKPVMLQMLREYAVKDWGFIIVDGIEADDAVGILATERPDCVMVHIDKDIDMIPGKHYNFVKRVWYDVNEFEAIHKFYMQLLMGDRTDNILGVKGVGLKKAEKLLAEATNEKELYNICLRSYENNLDYLTENANLLWIQQSQRKVWTPPSQ